MKKKLTNLFKHGVFSARFMYIRYYDFLYNSHIARLNFYEQ
jgi:hypothetical protein